MRKVIDVKEECKLHPNWLPEPPLPMKHQMLPAGWRMLYMPYRMLTIEKQPRSATCEVALSAAAAPRLKVCNFKMRQRGLNLETTSPLRSPQLANIFFSSGSIAVAQISCPFSLGCVVSGIISFDKKPFWSRKFGPISRNFTFLMFFSKLGR